MLKNKNLIIGVIVIILIGGTFYLVNYQESKIDKVNLDTEVNRKEIINREEKIDINSEIKPEFSPDDLPEDFDLENRPPRKDMNDRIGEEMRDRPIENEEIE